MVAFTTALFYPYIDIKDEGWLKNSILYWKEIQTIVPDLHETPYKTKTSRVLNDAGLLNPLYVNEEMKEIRELAPIVLKHLDKVEDKIKRDSINVKQEIETATLYPNKIPDLVYNRIQNFGIIRKKESKTIEVESQFADYYMTLLATHLSEKKGFGPLTYDDKAWDLSTSVKLDANQYTPEMNNYNKYDYDRIKSELAPKLAQGILANLVLEKVEIDPGTPIDKLLKFRSKYEDELGRFRFLIDELASEINNFSSFEAMRQQANDIYENKIKPETNNLKQKLKSSNIQWINNNFLVKIFFGSTSSLLISLLSNFPSHYALIASTGISLTASAVSFNSKKQEILMNSPYTYYYKLKKKF